MNIIYMYGEFFKVWCSVCGKVYEWIENLLMLIECSSCLEIGYMCFYVVWFGEMLL